MMQRNAAILVLAMMLTSGCLGAVDDIEDELDRTIQIIVEDYPQLDLPERTRTQPTLQTYDECDALLLDLKNSLFDEMLVRLDQESYVKFQALSENGTFTYNLLEYLEQEQLPEIFKISKNYKKVKKL